MLIYIALFMLGFLLIVLDALGDGFIFETENAWVRRGALIIAGTFLWSSIIVAAFVSALFEWSFKAAIEEYECFWEGWKEVWNG